MIRRLRAWWRRVDGHYRQKRQVLLAAEQFMRRWHYAPASYEQIEIYLLQLGLLHLEAATILAATPKPGEAEISLPLDHGSHRVH